MKIIHTIPIYNGIIFIMHNNEALNAKEMLNEIYSYVSHFYFDIILEKFDIHFQFNSVDKDHNNFYINHFHPFNNNLDDKSVFAGVKRDSLSFKDIEKIYNGEVLTTQVNERLFKSFKNLNLSFEERVLHLKKNNLKPLVDNVYLPPHIENGLISNQWVNNQITDKQPIIDNSISKTLTNHKNKYSKFINNYT